MSNKIQQYYYRPFSDNVADLLINLEYNKNLMKTMLVDINIFKLPKCLKEELTKYNLKIINEWNKKLDLS